MAPVLSEITVSYLASAGHLSVLASGSTVDGEAWYAVKVLEAWCLRIGRDFQDEDEIIRTGKTLPKDQVSDFVSCEPEVLELYADMVHPSYLSL